MRIENQNIPTSPLQEPEKEKQKIVIARVDIEQQARDVAEEKLLSSKADLKGFRGFFDRVWKHNLAHEYYRQKEIAKARREIMDSGNLYAGEKGNQKDHESAIGAIVDRFAVEYEGETMLRAGESGRIVKQDTQDDVRLKGEVNGLIGRFASGSMTEQEFLAERKNIFGSLSSGLPGQSLFADNLLEIARQVKDGVAHGKGLDALDTDFDIVVGNARAGVETEAQYNAVDRITEKIQKSFVGKFVNEATVATAVSIAYGIIAKGTVSVASRWAKIVGPLGMGLSAGVGGVVAGVRENKRIKDERAQHGREMAKGKQIDSGSDRREELEKYRYETKNAGELTENLKTSLEALKVQPSEQALHMVLEGLTDIKSRLSFSEREKIDLISFSESKNIERERTDMYIAAAEAGVYLKKNARADWATFYRDEHQLNEYLQHAKEVKIQQSFLGEKTRKDEAFNKMKRGKVAWAVTKGFGVGLGVGLAAQEIGALAGSGKEGLLGGAHVVGQDHQYTALGSIRHYIAGESASEGVPALIHPDVNVLVPHPVATPSHETLVGTKDYVKGHENIFSKIKRSGWADNDTPRSDRNELKVFWGGEKGTGIDKGGNYVFNVKHMTQDGSFHSATHWDPQEMMKSGKMKLLVSLSGDTQNQVVEIPIDAEGNAIIDPRSEIGKLAFSGVGGSAKFLGKFAEVAVMGDKVNGIDSVSVLATHVGKGIGDIRTAVLSDSIGSVQAPVQIPFPTIGTPADIAYDVEAPFIIPMAGRRPMERLKNGQKATSPVGTTIPPTPGPLSASVSEPVIITTSEPIPTPEPPVAVEPDKTPEPSPDPSQEPPVQAIVSPQVTVPGAVKEPIDQKAAELARAAAWHTINKVEKYSDLNADSPEDRDRVFAELTRKLWTEFTVHEKPDQDARGCLLLMKLAGMKNVDPDNPNTVKKGSFAESGVTMDTGDHHAATAEEDGKRLIIDHHAPESDRSTSATRFVYETLIATGLLKREPYLNRFVEFVTKCDNLDLSPDERKAVYVNYHKSLYGLAYRMKTGDVLSLFRDEAVDPAADLSEKYLESHEYFNPKNGKFEPLTNLSEHIKEQMRKGKADLSAVERAGFVFDTGGKFGKILIDTKKNTNKDKFYNRVTGENNSNQLESFEKGYGGYLVWAPDENSFVLYTQEKMDERSVPGGFSQGTNVRGHMWMKGQDDKEKLTVTLEEILSKLSGKDFKTGDNPKLGDALKLDRKSKEMLALFDEGTLTREALLNTAEHSKIVLMSLLKDVFSQRANLDRKFGDKKKKAGKQQLQKKGFAEKIAIETLLELQPKVVADPTSESLKKFSGLFSTFELSYDAIKKEADEKKVTSKDLALSFVNSIPELKTEYETKLNALPADKRDDKAVEKLAIIIILEVEDRHIKKQINILDGKLVVEKNDQAQKKIRDEKDSLEDRLADIAEQLIPLRFL